MLTCECSRATCQYTRTVLTFIQGVFSASFAHIVCNVCLAKEKLILLLCGQNKNYGAQAGRRNERIELVIELGEFTVACYSLFI